MWHRKAQIRRPGTWGPRCFHRSQANLRGTKSRCIRGIGSSERPRPPRGWQTNLKELAAGGLQERRTQSEAVAIAAAAVSTFDSWDAPGAGPNSKFKPTVIFGRRTPSREPAAAAIRSELSCLNVSKPLAHWHQMLTSHHVAQDFRFEPLAGSDGRRLPRRQRRFRLSHTGRSGPSGPRSGPGCMRSFDRLASRNRRPRPLEPVKEYAGTQKRRPATLESAAMAA